jgi:extradiol dioxygenase family protein
MVNEIQPAQDVNKEINQNTTQEPHMHIVLTVSEWQQLHNQVYQMMT